MIIVNGLFLLILSSLYYAEHLVEQKTVVIKNADDPEISGHGFWLERLVILSSLAGAARTGGCFFCLFLLLWSFLFFLPAAGAICLGPLRPH